MPDWDEFEEPRYLREAQSGNVDSFGMIYTHYAEGIFRFLYVHLDNRLDVEDLTEEVFYRAWKALPQYEHQGIPFSAFLYRIARNVLTDFYRKAHRTKHLVSLNDVDENQGFAGALEDPSERVEQQDFLRLLGSLRADYRMVISLRFLSGLSPEETAKVMKRSIGAVRVLQFRALAAIRSLMSKQD